MRCAEPMRRLGPVDISGLEEALDQQDDGLWDADAAFRRQLAPYRKTRTIYLMMTLGGIHAPTQYLNGWAPLRDVFTPIAATIAGFFPGPGRVMNAQIALLPPGESIAVHTDRGPTLESSHRVHIPLVTHPDVRFEIEETNYSLEVGVAYELDNLRRHAVHNGSPIDRVHLIVDYLSSNPAAPA
ncbi:MAG: aspartyl/asparaginyl beta-hydroxylase domain-containing protein [Pseudomonadales bacterium]